VTNYPTVAGPDIDSSPALAKLFAQLQEKHGGGILAFLLYGSCLRSGDLFDGLLDIYLVCDRYRDVYRNPLLTASNRVLAPNVFYAQVEHEGATLRTKYSVLSRGDLRRGTSTNWFESYLWGRFAQPVRIVSCDSPQIKLELEGYLLNAARTFLRRAIPSQPVSGSVAQLWEHGLALSYASEIRTEGPGRSTELTKNSLGFFEQLTDILADSLDLPLTVYDSQSGRAYRTEFSTGRALACRVGWRLRRVQGKLLSALRLIKALFTFVGGLDYVAWKLQRHSGQPVEIPARVRRWPLIFMWGFFWRLYRQGLFR
jgi:hypothetical protein